MRYWLSLLAAAGALASPNVLRHPAVAPAHAAVVSKSSAHVATVSKSNHSLAGTVTRTVNTGGLKGDCSPRIIAQKGNPLCKQKCAPNFTPQYDGTCACNAPYNLNGDACSPVCTNGFSLSLDKTACVCSPRKFTSADGTTCSYTCPAGQFGASNHICTPCASNAKTCRDVNTATSCNAGFFLYQGNCVAQCPLQNYADSKNVCRACADSDASSCTDGGAKSATACMTKYLVNGQCLDGDSLPNGYYADPTTHTAKQCAPGVKSCTCGDANCATACGLDSNSNQLYLNFDGTCVAQCSSGSYNDPHTDACIACDSTALTCDVNGALTCGKDSLGTQLFLTPTNKCILAAAGVPGYYPDTDTNTFKPCLDGVTSCVGSGTNDALTCGTRSDGTTLFFNGRIFIKRSDRMERRTPFSRTGACVEAASCPPATWADPINNVCMSCDINETACKGNGEGQALACVDGTYLSTSGDCLNADQCTSSGAFWADSTNNACSACDAGEAACTGNGAGLATACATNSAGKQLYLYQGDCYTADACPAAYYPDNVSNSCLPCDPGALTCTGPSAALTCGSDLNGKPLYLNIDGMCVLPANCDSTTYSDPATRKCESCTLTDPDAKTCTSPNMLTCTNKFWYQGACVDCPDHYYGVVGPQVCSPCCDPNALTCNGSGALTCAQDWYLSGTMCVQSCPSGTYPTNGVCKACTDAYGLGAATCNALGPLTCNAGFVWSPAHDACITPDECSAITGGYYANNGQCTLCSTSWAYATQCTSAGPTQCADDRFVDINNKCALPCPPGYATDTAFTRGFYIDDSLFESTCQPCLDQWAVSCDQYTGVTTFCAWQSGFPSQMARMCPTEPVP